MIRAFKSTLEDLEEKRSEHSVHSLRSSRSQSGLRPLSDITYIDEDPLLRGSVSASAVLSSAATGGHHHHHRLQSPGERDVLRDKSHTSALTSDGLTVAATSGAGVDWERDRHQQNPQRQRQQRNVTAEHVNNNNRTTERKGGNSGAAVNGHHANNGNQSSAPRSHSNSQFPPIPIHGHESNSPISMPPTMSPSQLLTSPPQYQISSGTSVTGGPAFQYQMPAQLPPPGLVPVRYDILNYDSLPDLPADLPRLVHETSI